MTTLICHLWCFS
ncbi:hypothetical protein GQ600_3784 [Phytophthora cactorum]|nr:hypothetical protein GQ600_3784 [Phytophthora cactorum]